MARSKNCLKCHYCKVLGGWDKSTDWRNDWYCEYYIERGNADKGTNPDKCLLFEPKRKDKPKRHFN